MRIVELARAVDVTPAELARRIFVARYTLYYEPKKITPTIKAAVRELYAMNQERKNKAIQGSEELCRARDKILGDLLSKWEIGGEVVGK